MWGSFLLLLILSVGIWTYLIRKYLFPVNVQSVDLRDSTYNSWICDAEKTKEIYNTYIKVRDLLEKHNYDHWLGYGSLIGGARHKGIIPWDDDIDLIVIVEDNNRKINLENMLKRNFQEHELQIMGFGIQINNCVDLFYYSYHNEIEKYQITNRVMYFVEKSKKDKHSFRKDELYPLKRIPFGPTYAWVPNEYINVLDRTYPNWDKRAIIQIPHQISVHNKKWDENFYRSTLRFGLNHGIGVTINSIKSD